MAMNAARWRLDGQTCLITGATKGIGLACAREFAALGADVLMVARDEAHLEQASVDLTEEFPEREIFTFAADVAEREQRLEVFDWIADIEMPLSLVVNNVGSNVSKSTLELLQSLRDPRLTFRSVSGTSSTGSPSLACTYPDGESRRPK